MKKAGTNLSMGNIAKGIIVYILCTILFLGCTKQNVMAEETNLEDVLAQLGELNERVNELEERIDSLESSEATQDVEIEGFGSISGNITYYYNDFKGNVSDTGSLIYLFPSDGSAADAPRLDSYVLWSFLSEVNDTYAEYNVFATEVDGMGEYIIQNVPAGDYVALMISENTTAAAPFDDRDAYVESVQNSLTSVIGEDNAYDIGYYIGFQKFNVEEVSIREDQDYVLSYDFGITYM